VVAIKRRGEEHGGDVREAMAGVDKAGSRSGVDRAGTTSKQIFKRDRRRHN
jgi:hypothetical protein